jgi:Flp pilus assembly protein TadG
MAFVMTVSIAALLGAIALCTDVGLLYYNWGLLQKAADSAVLAGANSLPSDATDAVAAADTFAAHNGIRATEIVATTVSADQRSITMSLLRTVPYCFAQLVGLSSGQVAASATAGVQNVGAVGSMLPVGIDSRTTYTYGQQVSLLTGQYGPGNWGPLALGATGASTFDSNVTYGYAGSVDVGQMLTTETGQMVGPTQSAFNARITAGADGFPDGTFADHAINDPRILTVPMVNYAAINGNSQVPVLGFAELWLVGIDSHQTITTYFIQQVANGTVSAAAPNYGAYQVVLIK